VTGRKGREREQCRVARREEKMGERLGNRRENGEKTEEIARC